LFRYWPLLAALVVARFLSSLLFGIGPADPAYLLERLAA
jgi:hypothetical protein